MQNVFHVKIVKMHYFSLSPLGTVTFKKNQLATHFACFTQAQLLLGAWLAVTQSAREAFGSQKSTNLIGDDGEQLTSSCERKDREKIIRNERHLRRAMCWFMETIEMCSCSAQVVAINMSFCAFINIDAPLVITTDSTHFPRWSFCYFSS